MEAKNISYSYDEKTVIDNLSIELPDKGITSIIGPNGSGKSTLLKILTGQIKDYQGNVFYNDNNLREISIKNRSSIVAYFNQREKIYGSISVQSILDLSNHHDIDYSEYLEYLNLTDKLDVPFNSLSGGQQQVLLIIAVLIESTEYVYLDEPFNNLDPKYKKQVVKLIKDVKNKQSFFIVDHDLDTLAQLSDYVILYNNGSIIKQGKTTDIIQKDSLENTFETEFNFNLDNDGNSRIFQSF
ncbi:ABC transporter ATP-binding protein [Lactobacillus terrae]|uniref:ABC transporter ATP-binding protein n=1 Tax=Lactobacillus terrae TaxID=2269374 RepID=UPI000C1B7693|nr:ABC transporter ATP-binding protein [Lactobacillus terrae]